MFTTLKSRDAVEGSGMGLAVIRKQVRLFGGDVTIESDPSKKRGARFGFSWQDHRGMTISPNKVEGDLMIGS